MQNSASARNVWFDELTANLRCQLIYMNATWVPQGFEGDREPENTLVSFMKALFAAKGYFEPVSESVFPSRTNFGSMSHHACSTPTHIYIDLGLPS